MAAVLIIVMLPLSLILAAATDLLTMKIPNRIPLVLLLSFLLLVPFTSLTWSEIGTSFIAALLVFIVCFGLFSANVMGGGDAKLLTATAIWYGFNSSLVAFLTTVAFAGGVVTLAFLLLRTQSHRAAAAGIWLPVSLTCAKKIPYGIAIAIGGFLTLGQSPLYIWALDTVR